MEKASWQYPPDRCEIVRYTPADLAPDQSLSILVKQYALDLRRNASGGDDYPYEYAKATADYLEELIKRAKGNCTCAKAGFPNSCDNCDGLAPTQQQPGKLTGDQIMQVIRKVTSGELREMLTCKRWKDGIDIDQPTFAAERLAEEFRVTVTDTSTDRLVDEIAARSPGVPKATIRKLLESSDPYLMCEGGGGSCYLPECREHGCMRATSDSSIDCEGNDHV